jgi:GT2 family glycosyltransferase
MEISGFEDTIAIIVKHKGSPYFEKCLESLLNQSIKPRYIVIACLGHYEEYQDFASVEIANPTNFTNAIKEVLENLELEESVKWVYAIHEDSIVDKDSLKYLHSSTNHSKNLCIIGSKQLTYDGKYLTEVGFNVTKKQHRYTPVLFNEADNGQYDSKSDVFGVSLNNALIDIKFLKTSGYTDPKTNILTESQVLCVKAHLQNLRIEIEPKSVVMHAGQSNNDNAEGIRYFNMYFNRLLLKPKGTLFFYHLYSIIKLFFLAIASLVLYDSKMFKIRVFALNKLSSSYFYIFRNRKKLFQIASLPFNSLEKLFIDSETYKNHLTQYEANEKAALRPTKLPTLSQVSELEKIKKNIFRSYALVILLGVISTIVFRGQELLSIFSSNAFVSPLLNQTSENAGLLIKSVIDSFYFTSYNAPNQSSLVLFFVSILGIGSLQVGLNIALVIAPIIIAISGFYLAGTFTRKNFLRITFSFIMIVNPLSLSFLYSGDIMNLLLQFSLIFSIAFIFRASGLRKYDLDIEPLETNRYVFLSSLALLFVSSLSFTVFIIALLASLVILIVKSDRVKTAVIALPSIILNLPIIYYIVIHFSINKLHLVFLNSINGYQDLTLKKILTGNLIDFSNFSIFDIHLSYLVYGFIAAIFIIAIIGIFKKGSSAIVAKLFCAISVLTIMIVIINTVYSKIDSKYISYAPISTIIFVALAISAIVTIDNWKSVIPTKIISAVLIIPMLTLMVFGAVLPVNEVSTTQSEIVGAIGQNIERTTNSNILVISQTDYSEYNYRIIDSKNIDFYNNKLSESIDELFAPNSSNYKEKQFVATVLQANSDSFENLLIKYRIGGIQVRKDMSNPEFYDELVADIGANEHLVQMSALDDSAFWQYDNYKKLPPEISNHNSVIKFSIQFLLIAILGLLILVNLINVLKKGSKTEAFRSEE